MGNRTLTARATTCATRLNSTWTDDMTKSDAEFLLDRLEQAGFRDVKVRCTSEDLFAVQLPSERLKRIASQR